MSEETKVEDAAASAAASEAEAQAVWTELRKERTEPGEAAPSEKLGSEEGKTGDGAPAEAPAPQPVSKETTDDPWKDAPPALREALEAERKRADAAETTVKRHSGRLSQLTRNLNELQSRHASERDKAAAPKEGEEATDRDARVKQLREEYPDLAAPLLDMMADQEAEIRALKDGQASQATAQTEDLLQEQLRTLEQAHPKYREDVSDPAFLDWATKQPDYVQEAIRRNATEIVDGASAADVITRYKAETADPAKAREEQRRKEQLEAGRGVDTRQPSGTAAGSESDEGIWAELSRKRAQK